MQNPHFSHQLSYSPSSLEREFFADFKSNSFFFHLHHHFFNLFCCIRTLCRRLCHKKLSKLSDGTIESVWSKLCSFSALSYHRGKNIFCITSERKNYIFQVKFIVHWTKVVCIGSLTVSPCLNFFLWSLNFSLTRLALVVFFFHEKKIKLQIFRWKECSFLQKGKKNSFKRITMMFVEFVYSVFFSVFTLCCNSEISLLASSCMLSLAESWIIQKHFKTLSCALMKSHQTSQAWQGPSRSSISIRTTKLFQTDAMLLSFYILYSFCASFESFVEFSDSLALSLRAMKMRKKKVISIRSRNLHCKIFHIISPLMLCAIVWRLKMWSFN